MKKNLDISSPEKAIVDSVTGDHKDGYNNDDVIGLNIQNKNIEYFPQGLGKFFENLKGLQISHCNLKEIHQSDLKQFPNLIRVDLFSNNIKVLEEGLFEFNPNLEWVDFDKNKITQIHPNIFDHLSELSSLYLRSNKCINTFSWQSKSDTKELIEVVKEKCSPATTVKPTTSTELVVSKINQEMEDVKEDLGKQEFNSTIYSNILSTLETSLIQKLDEKFQELQLMIFDIFGNSTETLEQNILDLERKIVKIVEGRKGEEKEE